MSGYLMGLEMQKAFGGIAGRICEGDYTFEGSVSSLRGVAADICGAVSGTYESPTRISGGLTGVCGRVTYAGGASWMYGDSWETRRKCIETVVGS